MYVNITISMPRDLIGRKRRRSTIVRVGDVSVSQENLELSLQPPSKTRRLHHPDTVTQKKGMPIIKIYIRF